MSSKRVTFNLSHNEIHVIPREDRTSPWMAMAADRYRFQRRIREVEQVLNFVLQRHVCWTYVLKMVFAK